MAGAEGDRQVPQRFLGFPTGYTTISEEMRANFCDGCDYFKPNSNTCAIFTIEEQAELVMKQKCTYAGQNGRYGTMTSSGFDPGVKPRIK